MLKILLVRPGSTDFDEQHRIKGTLDIPLNHNGTAEVARTAVELSRTHIDAIYSAPCQSCEQTADALASGRDVKRKKLKGLKNLDHGLWHGKTIEEVKQRQPKVYRQWQDHPETVCPPDGESLADAQSRIKDALAKLLKKHHEGVIALVVPEPLMSLVTSLLNKSDLQDLWQAECQAGGWQAIDVEPATA